MSEVLATFPSLVSKKSLLVSKNIKIQAQTRLSDVKNMTQRQKWHNDKNDTRAEMKKWHNDKNDTMIEMKKMTQWQKWHKGRNDTRTEMTKMTQWQKLI